MPTYSSEQSVSPPNRTAGAQIECWAEHGTDATAETTGPDTYNGGNGGRYRATFDNIDPNDTLYIRFPAGGIGQSADYSVDKTAYTLTGGDGGRGCGVRKNGTSFSDIIASAGGGGGGAGYGPQSNAGQTDGGMSEQDGVNGNNSDSTAEGGFAGVDGSTGFGGHMNFGGSDAIGDNGGTDGSDGSGAAGGDGGVGDPTGDTTSGYAAAGGGGGGGYGGGGGGAAWVLKDSSAAAGGGGGGGSGVVNGTENLDDLDGGLSSPQVEITWHQVPIAPSNLSGNFDGSSINLSWTDNSSSEDGFRIYRGTSSGNLSSYATVGANTTSYSDTSISAGTTYYYHVVAYNTHGESGSTNEEQVQTASPPSTPQNLTSSEI